MGIDNFIYKILYQQKICGYLSLRRCILFTLRNYDRNIKMTAGTSNMDAKREEFRKYLEREGVLEFLTNSLVSLYEESDKPTNALDYLKKNVAGREVEETKQKFESQEIEIKNLKRTVEDLKTENSTLSSKVARLEKQLEEARQNKPNEVNDEDVTSKEDEKVTEDVLGKPAEIEDESMETEENEKEETPKIDETKETETANEEETPEAGSDKVESEKEEEIKDDAVNEEKSAEASEAETAE